VAELASLIADAQVACRGGYFDKALALMDEATTRFAHEPEAWRQRAQLCRALELGESALLCCEMLVGLTPDDGAAWFDRGRVLQDLGRLDEAAEAYGKGATLDPCHIDSWVNWGCVLDDSGHHAEAIERYDRALALDAKEAIAWGNRGNSLMALGRNDEALTSYEEALRLGNDSIALGRCECLLALGRVEAANRARPSDSQDPGEARERRLELGDRVLVARYFIGRHSNPEMLDHAVEEMLRHVAACADRPPGIQDGTRIAYGLPILTLRARGRELALCEDNPWHLSVLREHVGFTAMHIVMLQLTHTITELPMEGCSYRDTIACAVGALRAGEIVMHRHAAASDGDSGWTVHAAGELDAPTAPVPLSRMSSIRPHVLKVVTLPVGCTVTMREHAVVSVVDPDGAERFR
jgi:tetratricopeptide (TPR) repeat protein